MAGQRPKPAPEPEGFETSEPLPGCECDACRTRGDLIAAEQIRRMKQRLEPRTKGVMQIPSMFRKAWGWDR